MGKRGFIYYLKIYKKIVLQDLHSKMSYRADFIISIIAMLITNITQLLTFWVIFQKFPSIKGWNYHEMIFLYGFSLVAITPECFFDNNWKLRAYVYSGDFIKYCFRPLNLFFYYISEVVDVKGVGQLFFGIGALAYSMSKLHITLTFVVFIRLLIALITSSLFMIAIMNTAAASCFWVLNSGYIMTLVYKFKDYARYPITIFNSFFRLIFTFVIPIAFVAYYPSLLIIRQNYISVLTWISPVMAVFYFYLSYKIWMKGALSYDGTGS
ncbi:ABC transporter permease [[Clostridium] polysaccharolyticum]|uniref:ABC-2 type transport system permease protein n=1 Tax=[Clostridium] polysaccharolyticum TaxID=29364 RepID=A0A1I0G3R5_9FIRM|nr:ABC-2 family transporter protein [[Clostridium] polysaccharolyticum]SET64527.1 ABC-2 type transport system permease protein [[Clostridium] polysaccharolyticum]